MRLTNRYSWQRTEYPKKCVVTETETSLPYNFAKGGAAVQVIEGKMGSFRCSVTVIRTVVQVCAAWADRAQLRMQLQFSQCSQEPAGV